MFDVGGVEKSRLKLASVEAGTIMNLAIIFCIKERKIHKNQKLYVLEYIRRFKY